MEIIIKEESERDHGAITQVNDAAFGRANEGRLVVNLRQNEKFVKKLSLVAIVDLEVVGHILFFPVDIKNGRDKFGSLALAPMAVLPEFQNQGIGSALARTGLAKAERSGFPSVVVLGHREYYPRFGFKPAEQFGIKAPFPVPENAFFALELAPGALEGVGGTAVYPAEFNEV